MDTWHSQAASKEAQTCARDWCGTDGEAMINTSGDLVGKGRGMAKKSNFGGKKAAPFKAGGGRKKSSTKTATGKKKR